MARLVNVHYLDKTAFFSNNVDDDDEKVLVFNASPSYVELVEKVRGVLNWMDPNDRVELIGRYDVGVGSKSRMKKMHIDSDLNWEVYKDKVEASEDKSIELFATKFKDRRFEIDLNRDM